MSQPLWATPERQSQLVKFAMKYKGVCLKGHTLCSEIEHYTQVVRKVEIASGPISAADVRDGWAIAPSCHGVGIVELAHAVSDGSRPIGPKRFVVQREELSDLYGQVEEQAIETWKAEDREERSDERRRASQHAPTGEVGRFGAFHQVGRNSSYDPVDIDLFVNERPRYYLKGYGVDDRLRRFARIQIPGTTVILKIDISLGIQELSKRRRKSLRRTGIKLQFTEQIILAAVAQWWG